MKKIIVINGPNLNKLGEREPDIYGQKRLVDIENNCQKLSLKLDIQVKFFQSNSESEIVEYIQNSVKKYDGMIINAAALTHTSISIHDSLKLLKIPIIEVHLSNPFQREEFRRKSYISPVATAILSGFGPDVYKIAIQGLVSLLEEKNEKD